MKTHFATLEDTESFRDIKSQLKEIFFQDRLNGGKTWHCVNFFQEAILELHFNPETEAHLKASSDPCFSLDPYYDWVIDEYKIKFIVNVQVPANKIEVFFIEPKEAEEHRTYFSSLFRHTNGAAVD